MYYYYMVDTVHISCERLRHILTVMLSDKIRNKQVVKAEYLMQCQKRDLLTLCHP